MKIDVTHVWDRRAPNPGKSIWIKPVDRMLRATAGAQSELSRTMIPPGARTLTAVCAQRWR
ncbi:MAG: hypothetical protein E6G57_03425 [Actinobacteria bacterium]|nr:MAG: hypothetical protein E6G57_03425 [Actinomycetota bacterium]